MDRGAWQGCRVGHDGSDLACIHGDQEAGLGICNSSTGPQRQLPFLLAAFSVAKTHLSQTPLQPGFWVSTEFCPYTQIASWV